MIGFAENLLVEKCWRRDRHIQDNVCICQKDGTNVLSYVLRERFV